MFYQIDLVHAYDQSCRHSCRRHLLDRVYFESLVVPGINLLLDPFQGWLEEIVVLPGLQMKASSLLQGSGV